MFWNPQTQTTLKKGCSLLNGLMVPGRRYPVSFPGLSFRWLIGEMHGRMLINLSGFLEVWVGVLKYHTDCTLTINHKWYLEGRWTDF